MASFLTSKKLANEQEAKHIIEVLKSMGYLKDGIFGTHKFIALTDSGRCYFETKREARYEKLFKIAPIAISVIALLKSFQNELILAWQLLMQLLK